MKKHYLNRAMSLTLGLVTSLTVSAQLSGIVTINNGAATSGSNYNSFSALAAVINTAGVNGPLTVNVVSGSGPYNEQVNFLQTPGISASNTITVNGNGCTVTFAGTAAAPWTILLNGADYMTFNNLNVNNTGASNALAGHLWNNADYNTFNSCTFSVSVSATGTGLSPFSISGTSVSATATGPSGSNNTVNSCTMTGGYYNTVFTGPSTAPYATNNQLLGSVVREFYLYGLYAAYNVNMVARLNIVERPTRATISTGYGMYLTTGTTGALVERNHVRNLAGGNVSTTSSMYCIYVVSDGGPGSENKVRNNLVSDIRCSGVVAGLYLSGASYCWAEHNTVVFDDANATAGTTYGAYCTGPNNRVRNNIVYITRGGTGTKYCVYLSTAAIPLICNYNVLYINAPAGTNYTGYLSSAYSTLANWQSGTGFDMNSSNADPVFTNPSLGNYVPTAVAVNNLCLPAGISSDFNNSPRSPVFPDPGAFEFYNTPCNGTPGPNSFVTPTMALCPGTTQNFSLTASNTYTNSGYVIQWYASTASNLGPYTVSPNGTLNAVTTAPINQTSYFVAVITCTNGQGSFTTTPGTVLVAPTTTATVPYYESFESLALNQLPNCSWMATSMGGATQTYTAPATGYRVPRTGSNYATFANSPAGTNYYYSNGIWLNPGITYSAALWFVNETANTLNWPDLSITIGTAQNPGAMNVVASTGGTLTPNFYTLLSNTFSVAVPGLYYVGVRATSGAGVSQYLTWDDLSITIPCSLNGPQLQVSASTNPACANQPVSIYAVGANTYQWSTGQTVSSILVSPAATTGYTLVGTNTLSGCSNTVVQTIVVKPTPFIAAFANDPASCPGVPVTISAQGGIVYNWSTGDSGPTATVSPMATTVYSVVGTNSVQCSGVGTVQVVVNPAPNVNAVATSTYFCAGAPITFNGNGATSYQWFTGMNTVYLGNPVTANPTASDTWTLVGTNAAGCEGRATITFGVEECTGISELNSGGLDLVVYPIPAHESVVVKLPSEQATALELTDMSGRSVLRLDVSATNAVISLTELANGVYYLHARSATWQSVTKVVKQ